MRDWKQGSGSASMYLTDQPRASGYGAPSGHGSGHSDIDRLAEIARLNTDLRTIEARLAELRQALGQSATAGESSGNVNPNAVAAEQLLHRYMRSI